jgi:hypothetical protein
LFCWSAECSLPTGADARFPISLHTDAREMPCFFATCVRLSPEAAVSDDLLAIDVKPRTPDLPTLKFRFEVTTSRCAALLKGFFW